MPQIVRAQQDTAEALPDSGHLPSPTAAIAAWPRTLPLAAVSTADAAGRRWTLLASPVATRRLASLDDLALPPIDADAPPPAGPPLVEGTLVSIGYEAGGLLEPAAATYPADRPLLAAEIRGCLAFEHAAQGPGGAWHALGDTRGLPDLTRLPAPARCRVGRFESNLGAAGYMDAAARALAYIRAGDVYQVNLAHKLRAPFEGSPRALFARLAESARPRFGVYLEDGDCAVCSLSPELFLGVDPRTREVRTSPMKGTRPIDGDAAELAGNPKDRAELAMIVDLMRNDLGRVARFGSVRVEAAREIERHGSGVLQATATVRAELRAGLELRELLAATFPPGSVTGAPKIRAMQIIGELEPCARGAYCGAVGWIAPGGRTTLAVAIRTAVERGGAVEYHAGAGIVADSDPAAEWAETLVKARVVTSLGEGGP